MKNVFIDLFSGFGGASAAFDEDDNWMTIKIDNEPSLLEHDRGIYIMDIARVDEILSMIRCQVPFKININKLVVWASPPCDQFSWVRADRIQGQTSDDFDLTLLDATRHIIEALKPDYWIIENVEGAIPIFNEELERSPTQQIGSVVMWGNFPLIPIEDRANFKHRKLDSKGSRLHRPRLRAKIPYEISKGLLTAVTTQRTLFEFGKTNTRLQQ